MKNNNKICVIIPALNEEKAIGKVISHIPEWVDKIVVVDNGSIDNTIGIAQECGAIVVKEPVKGYGAACLRGIATLQQENPDIVVFLDGDFSDRPQEMASLVAPIAQGQSDLVIGSRTIGKREKGALTPQAIFGNWLACHLIYWFWRVRYTDLGPFRAISYTALQSLRMEDTNYGWTVEMQIKAAGNGLKVQEIPVSYHRRIGKSKISGTIKGVVLAGYKILFTIFAYAWNKNQPNNL